MKKEINFIWESEKKIKVSQVGEKNSLFYEAYQQALAGVIEIVRASRVYSGRRDPFCQASDSMDNCELLSSEDRYFYNYPNNMIVFSGERGAGKSSAMLTFVNGLKDHKSRLYRESFLQDVTKGELPDVRFKDVSNMLEMCQFISLPPIDPTVLENEGQILIVILARMYQLASDVWNQQEKGGMTNWKLSTQDRINKKNELMRRFSVCYEHVNAIKNWEKKCSEYEGLDVLTELGDSSRLKNEFAELVENLLKFCAHDEPDDQYLVIQIDDTDMNIQRAYGMLEDIRKYLMIPRVIIIMAADLTHLAQVVESSVLTSYENRSENAPGHAKNIARQYIVKLFPQTRQINLPNLGTYFKEHADNILIKYNTFNASILPDNDKRFQDVQEQIFRLIYKKTGLVFLKYKNLLHYIVPGNMRHLAHFLAMLVQMEEIEDPDEDELKFFLKEGATEAEVCKHKKDLRIRLQNVQRFRDYFLTTWVAANLDDSRAKKMNELVEIDISKKVRYACMHLPYRTDGEEKYGGNCSYADMIRLCRDCEKTSIDEMDSRFIFAIQTYFSLLGHSVVLEELIDYHDQDDSVPHDDFKCPFSRLYPLFGSRLFSYNFEGSDDEDDERFASVRLVPSAENAQNLCLRWHPEMQNAKELDPVVISVLGLLCSMFADYEKDKTKITFDLCSLITNCLYVGDHNKMTPVAQFILGGKTSTAGKVEDKDWRAVRNSALMTVLNWDVQQQIGNQLSHIIVESTNTTKRTVEEWAYFLKEFYSVLVLPFKSQSGDLAIAALKRMQFGGWFEPVFLDIADIETRKGWNDTATKLLKDLGKNTEQTTDEASEKNTNSHASPTKEESVDADEPGSEPTDDDHGKQDENSGDDSHKDLSQEKSPDELDPVTTK